MNESVRVNKKLVAVSIAIAALMFGYRSYETYQGGQRDRRMSIAQNSFETGCYFFAQTYGFTLKNEIKRAQVFDLALKDCQTLAVQYREWLQRGAYR